MALTRLDNLYSSKTGKYLYVSPDDFNATDELDNRGNSPLRPFKTIQRAFIEVARFSYLPGSDNDRFDQFSIMLMPGDHYIDNRPGLVDIDRKSRQRYYDARNLINANRQEIIDRAFAEIAIEYDESLWGVDWVVPGDSAVQDSNRYYDAYRLIQKNRKQIIDTAVAQIAIDWEDFNFPEDPVETEYSRYKDAYRLIQNNKVRIVNDTWAQVAAAYPSVVATETKCKRDITYFIDAVSLDVFTGGNYYSRQFVIQYFDGTGVPLPNGLPVGDPLDAAILAWDEASARMKAAITNTYVSDLVPGTEYQDLTVLIGNPTYDPGNPGGDVPNTDPSACFDVQTFIDNLTTTVKDPLTAQDLSGLAPEDLGDAPDSEIKCKRDLGFIVDYISLDVAQGGGNVYTRKVVQNYFNEAGTDWVDDGLQGEEDQSITAFNKARDVMLEAITNQLYYKDLTVTHDSAGTGSGIEYDPAACADVQNYITTLFVYLTDAVSNGTSLGLPAEEVGPLDPGETKCKRDIGYIVDAVSSDLANGGNAQSIAAAKAYFDVNGLPIENGILGEESQSVIAFQRAAVEMQKAVTNQLLSKDLTLLAGPAEYLVEGPVIPVLPSGNAAACVDVQSSIATLTTLITDVLAAGDLSLLTGVTITGDVPIFNYNQTLEEWNDNTILDLSNPDNALYKFNSSTGGAIVPRGCSLIGYDLRRTIVRPLYVPDPVDATQERTSIFNLTGGCYLWQFTIKDGDLSSNSPLYNPSDKVGRVYYQKGNTNLATPEYSHHKITIMTYADEKDLDEYYEKVGRSFSLFQPTIDDGDLEALVQENRIVGPLSDTRNITNIRLEDNPDVTKTTVVVTTKIAHGYFRDQYVAIIDNGLNDLLNGTFKVTELDDNDPRVFKYEIDTTELVLGLDINAQGYDFTSVPALDIAARVQAEIDSVESASPYVFNCSIRSTWGQCGMWADGSKATGFKSMVVAQYTGVSLQRDDRAYIRYDEFTNTWNQASITDAFATEPYHTRGDAYWKDDWRNFHIRASDDAFIQCVSVFAVGFFDHFLMESGGDMSITNSNSNFGNTSLHAIGFKGFSFNQDKGGYITDIVPVEQVNDSAFNETQLKYYSLDAQVTKDASNTDGRLYFGADTIYDPFEKPVTSVEGFRLGAKSGEEVFLSLKGAGGINQIYNAEVTPSGFQRYTVSLDTLNPDGLAVDNYAQDASNSIERNKLYIQQEAYGYILDKYPYLLTKPGIEIGKCERDIGYFVDAVVQDLRVGGNIQTIQAAEAYFVGGSLTYIPGELNETVEALDYVKNLCIAAMRNFDILYRDCQTDGTSVVDVGDTTGLLVGMEVVQYDYNTTNFTDGRLNPGATPVSVNPSIPANTFIKRIIDDSRIELGISGSLPSTIGDEVPALNTNSIFIYFSLPQTATLLDDDDVLTGAWAAENPVRDSSIVQDSAGVAAPTPWPGLDNEYPECVNIASTIETYFGDINVILNQGLQPISEREQGLSTLILANKELATEEALDRAKANFPTQLLSNQAQLVDDVKETIDAYAFNVLYGGNDRSYDRGVFYTANPSRTNGEEIFTTFLYDEVFNILNEVIRNVSVIITGDHGLNQVFDLSIVPDLPPQIPGTYGPGDFVDIEANLSQYRDLVNAGIGTDVIVGDVTSIGVPRVEPVVGGSVTRVEPTVNTANLATRATIFTVNTGGGVSDPHKWETGTPIRLVPKARAGTNPDKRVIRLPRGLETNTIYYVIAPGRTTQPENYADAATYPGIFEASSQTKLMLASTKENAAAGIYLYSSETDSVDPDLEIEIQQYVLDLDYSLHQYLCNEVSGLNDVLQTDVPHVFDVPGSTDTIHKVFFRTFGNNSTLPQIAGIGGGPIDPNTYYYARYVTPKTFSIFETEAEALAGATPIVFSQGFGQDFYVFSDKRRSPVKFDAELTNANTSTGQWYIQTVPDIGNSDNIIDRMIQLGVTLTDTRTKNAFFTRLNDDRPAEDRVYRLRYVIPRYATGVRDPLNGFVIKARTDETRRLVAQRIVLQNLGGGAPVATFNVPIVTSGGTIQQALGLPTGDPGLDPNLDYDAYDASQVKIIDSDRTDSKISFSIMSARQIDIGGIGDPNDLRLELTVFNHGINNNALKNEKFTVVKINAPQGGSFRVDELESTVLNRVTWSGYSSGSGYIQGYFNPDGTNDHYLIIKAIESSEPIEYNQFVNTVFAQPVLDGDNDPTFDINGNPINIFATLQAKPDSAGNEALSKSAKEDYLYSNKDANVLTMVPGDVIIDDSTSDYEVISVEDVGDFEDSFYIFDINEIQRRIPNQQEGIYYLTCLRGNISPFPTGPGVGDNFRNFKFSQPISQLYPLNYKNDPLWFQVQPDGSRDSTILDPPETICAADNYVHGLVRTNDSKNSETKESILDFISNPALSRYEYITNSIEAQTGNATSGSEDRRISIVGDSLYKNSGENKLFVELRRPSIARSGNHTFEYLGFGPGNYSTGFPLRQEVVLSDIQDFYAQSKREDAGIVFYTGLNSNGDLYIGNKKINAITGEETFLESAQLVETDDEEGDLGGLVTTFPLPVVFEKEITVDGNASFGNPVTISVDPIEGNALTVVSNVDFNNGGDQTLDSSSFNFSNIPSEGNIVATQNNLYAAIYRLNPRGTTTLSGQNYSWRTHVDPSNGNLPSNHTPNQTNASVGIPITYGSDSPLTGDTLYKGLEVGKTGSLGWIYSNFYVDNTAGINTISATTPVSNRAVFTTIFGTSPADLGISTGSQIRLSGFSGRFQNINGIRTALNVTGTSFEVEISFLIVSDPGDPTTITSLPGSPLIEVSVDQWKETGILGTESIRTLTDDYGDFKVGINTLARATHGPGGDQEEGFVSDAVLPRANFDVVGTAWISGKVLETGVSNNFLLNPDPNNRTFLTVDHAFLVGGDSSDPSQEATFRISTTNNGRVGINVDFSELDRTFVVDGDMRITDDCLLEQNLTIGGESLISQTTNFNLLPTVTTRLNFVNIGEELNIANQTTADQEINLGNISGNQIVNIGRFSPVTEFNLHSTTENGVVRIATAGNNDSSFSSVIELGGAYANTSDDLFSGSILKVYNRFAYFDGDIRVGQALTPGSGIARFNSPAQTFNLLTTTTTNINFGLSSTNISIGALGGTTVVNNSLEVNADTDLFGDVTLQGGLNAGQFELRRGSLGTPTTAHSEGNEIDESNIDFYKRTPINIRLSSEGAQYWGNEAEFKDTSVGFATDPTVYRLTIDQPATLLDFEVGSYVLIDRSVPSPVQGNAPVGEEYSELLEVIGVPNLNDVGPDPLYVRVRRARNQLDVNGDMILGTPSNLPLDAEPPTNYKYLRTDHPDQAVLVRFDFSANVSFLTQDLLDVAEGTLENVSTGNFSGSINVGDIFRLSSDDNSNLGELTTVTAINQVTNQQFVITDGGSPAITSFSVDSVTGDTFIGGKLTVDKSICLEGTTAPDLERLVITDGSNDADKEKFAVDSFDGETFIRGDLRVGRDNLDRFIVESANGNTTITEGNLVIKNTTDDNQLVFNNASGDLTIAGVIRTNATGENIFAGDVTINGADLNVNADTLIDRSGSNLTSSQIGETNFSINNDGSMSFAGQEAFMTPTGGRQWDYIGPGVQVQPISSNTNYFIAPAADMLLELPELPTHGDMIRITDVGGRLTYNVSLRIRAVDGTRVQGGADNSGPITGSGFNGGELLVQTPNAAFGLVYLGNVRYDGTSTGASVDVGWWLTEI